jgi:glycogen debranching enzyme
MRARQAFVARFINPASGALYDVVDVDHVALALDASVRPNQIFAVGGLPFRVLDRNTALPVVDQVERALLTPLGLRSLAPDEAAYIGRYTGTPTERDAAYHQGTIWPWLSGAFVDAWLYVHGDSVASRTQARQRFLAPLLAHLGTAGLGHVSEIADGDAPHEPRGCPFQAWSLGELIRIERMLNGPREEAATAGDLAPAAPAATIAAAAPAAAAAGPASPAGAAGGSAPS